MACRDARARCVRWQIEQRARCDRWRTEWTKRCERYRTETQHRCDRWRTTSERRCDRWEQDWSRRCDAWGPFKILCLLWTWISTWVCRAWVTVTTTVCEFWATITVTICVLWTAITVFVCDLWTLVTTIVCRAWVLILDIGCIIGCWLSRLRAPNEFSEARSECIYGWTARYRIEEDTAQCRVHIVLRLRLVPDAGVTAQNIAAVQALWEPAIENAWSQQFTLMLTEAEACPCSEYRVDVDVQWVTTGEHHAVTVRAGQGRANMTTWFVASTGGTAAHEAGHMFGNPDEYADTNCPSRVVTSDGSIMQTSQQGTVRQRHYVEFATWVTNRICCRYVVR
jgi:hypothetical protein